MRRLALMISRYANGNVMAMDLSRLWYINEKCIAKSFGLFILLKHSSYRNEPCFFIDPRTKNNPEENIWGRHEIDLNAPRENVD